MNMSPNTQATLLLTGYFNASVKTESKPLTVAEWSRFAEYLVKNNIQPSQFLTVDYPVLLEGFSDKTITTDRISALLKRGAAMALSLEKWSRANIWVISRADKEYPQRIKKKLGPASPPILYGCGNKTLLNKGGIGVVGSRKVSTADLQYTSTLATKAALSGFSIVSGGAKGVDQAAMLAALDTEGRVIGIMADSLLRASASRQYRQYIMQDNLVLISPFYPEAGFNAGNAMQRNKFIYCLSDATVVVHSGKPEASKSGGGTWTGALENLRKKWVPLWVKKTTDSSAGNALIVEKGGLWLSDDVKNVVIDQLPYVTSKQPSEQTMNLFAQAADTVKEVEQKAPYAVYREPSSSPIKSPDSDKCNTPRITHAIKRPESLYASFLLLAEPLLSQEKSADELAELLELNKTQLNAWLKKSVDNKKISKTKTPVRYQWVTKEQKKESLS